MKLNGEYTIRVRINNIDTNNNPASLDIWEVIKTTGKEKLLNYLNGTLVDPKKTTFFEEIKLTQNIENGKEG